MARDVQEEDIYIRTHEVQFLLLFFVVVVVFFFVFVIKQKELFRTKVPQPIVSLNKSFSEKGFRSHWFAYQELIRQ